VQIFEARSGESVEAVRRLFHEYASALDFDLEFQHFDDEMKTFPTQYSNPTGCLLVAYVEAEAVGCVGLRKYEKMVCEMKRLYVRPEFRGLNIGKGLAVRIIEEAGRRGYSRMRLDTVPSMQAAIALYRKLGFKEIPQYRNNPIPGALFFELQLTERR